MIQKFTIAAALLGLLMPAGASDPAQTPPQIKTYPDGFFYSSGRSYLGVDVRDITSDRLGALKLKEERGVEVTMVDQDAPAGKAGLKEHDVILEYNGARVDSEEQFRRMIRETPPGRNVTLGISRDGNAMAITAQIGDRAKLSNKIFKFEQNGPAIVAPQAPEPPDFNIPFDVQVFTYTPSLGIQVDNLNQQLGEYFGVKNGEGLLVKSVEKGSPAEKAGLKAGDVITRADNEKISDRADLRRILRSHRSGGKLTVGIVRDKHEQNLTIELPSHKSDDSSSLEFWSPDVDTIKDWASAFSDDLAQDTLLRLQPTLLLSDAENALQQVQPTLQKSMHRLDSEMQRLRKELEKLEKDWRMHDMF